MVVSQIVLETLIFLKELLDNIRIFVETWKEVVAKNLMTSDLSNCTVALHDGQQ